jgi:hypothetical protein
MEDRMVQLYETLNTECNWKEVKERTTQSAKLFEEQLRSQFPQAISSVTQRANALMTPLPSPLLSPNPTTPGTTPKKRKSDGHELEPMEEEGKRVDNSIVHYRVDWR